MERNVTYDGLVGKTIVQGSIRDYGPWLILKPVQGVIPALFKTLGDLSQYVYAAQYNTVVATGDRMGVGAGLYINAKGNRKVKCMIEDAATGFVIYSGFPTLNFRGRSSCNVRLNNSQACLRTTNVNPTTVANRLREAAPDQELLEKMIRNKPKLPPGLKGLPNQWISSANATNTAAANTIANSIIKFKNYWSEDDAKKLINAYSRLKNKISNSSKRAGIETVINSVLPEGRQLLSTRERGVRVVNIGSLTSGKRPGNASNVKQSPNSMKSPPVASQPRRPGSAPARIRASPKSKTKSAIKQNQGGAMNNNRQTPSTAAPRTAAPKTAAPRTAAPSTAAGTRQRTAARTQRTVARTPRTVARTQSTAAPGTRAIT